MTFHSDATPKERIERPKQLFIRVNDICGGQVTATTYPFPNAAEYVLSETRATAALHACEGLDTADLIGNGKGWLTEVVHDAARVEVKLDQALRARCPGNGGPDEEDPVCCQSYEASEQSEPCPPGCCVMAEEKDVRAILAAIEREDGTPSAARFSLDSVFRTVADLRVYAGNIQDADDRELVQHAADMIEVLYKSSAPSSAAEISEIEDALWALHSYESNRDDGGRVYTEANITQMVETVRSFRSPTPEAVRVAFDQVNKLAAELASLRSATAGKTDRDDIIEECARVCDLLAGLNVQGWGRKCTSAAKKCATEIRALK